MQLRGLLSASELEVLEKSKTVRYGADASRIHRGYELGTLILEFADTRALRDVITENNLSSMEGRRETSMRISVKANERLTDLAKACSVSKIAAVRGILELRRRRLARENTAEKRFDRREAVRCVKDYLQEHTIPYEADIDTGLLRITMTLKAANCPGRILESCIWFYEESMEVRTYYGEMGAAICKESGRIADLYRLLNFINARVWVRCSDGADGVFYAPDERYTPRFYLTEDDRFDITATTMIPYVLFDDQRLMTMDYITASIPELMDKLSPALFRMLTGLIDVQKAIMTIKKAINKEQIE